MPVVPTADLPGDPIVILSLDAPDIFTSGDRQIFADMLAHHDQSLS